MNKTANFQLTQWEKTDRIMMEDFNRDNAAIDAALKSNAEAVAALQTALAGVGNCSIEAKSYTGNGKYGQNNPTRIALSKKPKAAIIFGTDCIALMTDNGGSFVCLYWSMVNARPYFDSGFAAWQNGAFVMYSTRDEVMQCNSNGCLYQDRLLLNRSRTRPRSFWSGALFISTQMSFDFLKASGKLFPAALQSDRLVSRSSQFHSELNAVLRVEVLNLREGHVSIVGRNSVSTGPVTLSTLQSNGSSSTVLGQIELGVGQSPGLQSVIGFQSHHIIHGGLSGELIAGDDALGSGDLILGAVDLHALDLVALALELGNSLVISGDLLFVAAHIHVDGQADDGGSGQANNGSDDRAGLVGGVDLIADDHGLGHAVLQDRADVELVSAGLVSVQIVDEALDLVSAGGELGGLLAVILLDEDDLGILVHIEALGQSLVGVEGVALHLGSGQVGASIQDGILAVVDGIVQVINVLNVVTSTGLFIARSGGQSPRSRLIGNANDLALAVVLHLIPGVLAGLIQILEGRTNLGEGDLPAVVDGLAGPGPLVGGLVIAPTRNPEPGGGELQGDVSTFYQGGNPMKKFLSLVLALVMTMSLVTVSAGAKDFTDNSKIAYGEAVDVMSAVKVIDGYPDGSFNPTATLTRGAAAKIICNLILGPTTASALVADAAPYKDVPTNHTFAGYIAYCQKEGIISGYADGTFKPANSLTGYAFMKMLLGALGYKAEQEGYTGANWSINVAKRALNIGLDDDLVGSFNGVKAVNREEACLYAFNTLKATMVEYEKNSTVTVNGITFTNKSTAKEMENTAKVETIKDDNKMQFAEKYFDKLVKKDTTDDFGRPSAEWTYDKEKVGTFVDYTPWSRSSPLR